jgi:hypothetical protein
MADVIEDDDSDFDDVAYISSEDDASGPGCLLGISFVLSLVGIVIVVGLAIYALAIGLFDAQPVRNGMTFFQLMFMMVGLVLSLGFSGFGIGTGLHSLQNVRRMGREDLLNPARITSAIGTAGVVLSLALIGLIVGLQFMR